MALVVGITIDGRRLPAVPAGRALSEYQTVRGLVKWEAIVTGGAASLVQYRVDDRLEHEERHAPYLFNGGRYATSPDMLDTRKLSNGVHKLSCRVYYGSASAPASKYAIIRVNVQNGPPPSPAPPSTSLTQTIAEGAEIAGPTRWEAKASVPVSRVEFLVNGVVRHIESASPYEWKGTGTLSPADLGAGEHLLVTRATLSAGGTIEARARVSVASAVPDPPPPSPPPPAPSDGRETWRADPASGNYRQWSAVQCKDSMNVDAARYDGSNPRLTIGSFQGRPSFRSEIRKGEATDQTDASGAGAVRSDMYVLQDKAMQVPYGQDFSGQTWRYRFSIGFPWTDGEKYVPWIPQLHNVLWNLHTSQAQPGYLVSLAVNTWPIAEGSPGQIRLSISGGNSANPTQGKFPLADLFGADKQPILGYFNRWHDYELTIRFDSYGGWFELRDNGEIVLPRTPHPTYLAGDRGIHLKCAHYTRSIFADGTPYERSVLHHGLNVVERVS